MSLKRQSIRYTTTRDQVRLAWASSGSGPSLVKAANWVTHLEYDWESPVWRHWIEFLSGHFSLVRYDERGCGLSQRDVPDVSDTHWLPDLEDVVDAAQPAEPFVLLGISQGACPALAFAAAYPEKVSQLVIYGGYVEGWARSSQSNRVREGKALVELTELGWGRSDPVYRRLFTRYFLPDGREEQREWFDELCARSVHAKTAAQLLSIRGEANFSSVMSQVRTPTLIIHATGDRVSSFSQGQMLAAGIPGAEFLQVDSSNHILLEEEPAWEVFRQAVLEFTGVSGKAETMRALSGLTGREQEILTQLAAGHTNAEIGAILFISDKTVRNQLTRIYEKLGVSNRAQAIVIARDNGLK